MAETKKTTKRRTSKTAVDPETVGDALKLESGYWHLTDDELLLRSPQPEDEYKSSDSWRVFRIMSELVAGFDAMATVTRGVSIFGSARTHEDDAEYKAAHETA